jgi:cation-transporting ATPase E
MTDSSVSGTSTTSVADPATGLSAEQVRERIAAGQTNHVQTRNSRSLSSIIRENTITSFNIVIGSLWALMFAARAPIQDSLFGFVIVFNSAIGIIQEYRAKRTLEKLSLIGEAKPVVRRDGTDTEVSPSALVLDDIVVLTTGDQIVVDGDVLQGVGMEVDESLLTGEADPVHKLPGDSVMSGSFVVAGGGLMCATRVGMDSYATQLTEQARTFTTTKSELMDSIMRFVRTITWILIPLGILLFISQLQSAPTWEQALSGTVAGIVTMVPEGLVLLTSVAMAVAVVRLGRKRALVQEMPAVETLARVDVICVDKTGTLTEPGMAVNSMTVLDSSLTRSETTTYKDTDVKLVLGALGASEDSPNPTLAAVASEYPDPGWTIGDSVPFSSARKWSSATFTDHGTWLLGAPEILLVSDADGDPAPVRDAANEMAGVGARVLLLAKSAAQTPANGPKSDGQIGPIIPVALVAIDQRLRSDAAETVGFFLEQGVAVKVISGDNPVTVGAIAQQAGIPLADDPVDGSDLPSDPAALAEVLETHGVFGRVTPDQKRAMVRALQSKGHTVAMTGDGVNDVLALKDADLGIAMGSGAGATRAVAQIVLLDSKFSVLPSVVAEGRRVLGNIERVSSLFLTKSFYSAFFSIVTVLLTLTNIYKVEFVFLPRHLTLITWLTIGMPAFFIALMPNTALFQAGFFQRVLRFAVPAGLICGVFSFASYLLVLTEGDPLEEARTSAAITLFIIAWVVLALVSRPWNFIRLTIVVVMGAGFLIVLAVPWLSVFFGLSLGLDNEGATAVAFGIIGSVLLIAIRRYIEIRIDDGKATMKVEPTSG